MWGAIFSGVASLAGAILTRRDARKEAARVAAANRAEAARIQKANAAAAAKAQKQNTQVRQNYYKNVVSDAQSAGINPLTALRTGGGAGYATAVAGTMSNPVMMEGVYEAPTLSRNPLAAGLEAATNTYLSELTRQKQYTHEGRMDDLRKRLMEAQISSMTRNTSLQQGVYDAIKSKLGLEMEVMQTELHAMQDIDGNIVDPKVQADSELMITQRGNTWYRPKDADDLSSAIYLSTMSGLADLKAMGASIMPSLSRMINRKNTTGNIPLIYDNYGLGSAVGGNTSGRNRTRVRVENFAN